MDEQVVQVGCVLAQIARCLIVDAHCMGPLNAEAVSVLKPHRLISLYR